MAEHLHTIIKACVAKSSACLDNFIIITRWHDI